MKVPTSKNTLAARPYRRLAKSVMSSCTMPLPTSSVAMRGRILMATEVIVKAKSAQSDHRSRQGNGGTLLGFFSGC
jgi:hypothetical protein